MRLQGGAAAGKGEPRLVQPAQPGNLRVGLPDGLLLCGELSASARDLAHDQRVVRKLGRRVRERREEGSGI